MRTVVAPALRAALGLGLAATGGLLLTLAFAPYDLWPLAFVGFVPTIVAQHRVMPRRLSGLAYGVGLGSFYWGYFGAIFAGQHTVMVWVPLVAGLIATLASGGNRAFHERSGYRWFVLEGAVAWVAIEALRAIIPLIGTSGSVAVALASQPWLLQPVSVFGIFGLGLVIMGVNYGLALATLALVDRLRPVGPVVPLRYAGATVGGVLLALAAWTGLSLGLMERAGTPGTMVRVAALQPDLPPGSADRAARLIDMTRAAAAQGARLIVWPEGALSADPRVYRRAELTTLARETGAYIALGYAYQTAAGLVNAVLVVGPDGTFQEPYGKDHPVVWMGESSVMRGRYPTQTTPFGTVGTIICYDLNFTDTARRTARNGAQLVAVPSNDWPALAQTQYTNLVLRAVENRVAVIKADSRYDSAIIAPTGAIVARQIAADGRQALVIADVPRGTADAPLIRLGDWVGWLCIVGLVLFSAATSVSARRARRASSAGAATTGSRNFAPPLR